MPHAAHDERACRTTLPGNQLGTTRAAHGSQHTRVARGPWQLQPGYQVESRLGPLTNGDRRCQTRPRAFVVVT